VNKTLDLESDEGSESDSYMRDLISIFIWMAVMMSLILATIYTDSFIEAMQYIFR
jgi:hypothetical protein